MILAGRYTDVNGLGGDISPPGGVLACGTDFALQVSEDAATEIAVSLRGRRGNDPHPFGMTKKRRCAPSTTGCGASGRTLQLGPFDARGNRRLVFDAPMPPEARGEENPRDEKNVRDRELEYMAHLADVTGNGRPDLLVSTSPGTAVWIYRNDQGAKNLSPDRLTMPENATLY